jgi:hypothetical protein
MSMTITLPPKAEAALKDEARRHGVGMEEYAADLIVKSLPGERQAILDLLDEWDREEATDDPAEIAQRQCETHEFMSSLAAHPVMIERPISTIAA